MPDVTRFEFFAQTKEKKEGVWLVRQGRLQFALPVTTGTKPAIADYLSAPFGLPGFAAPVEEIYPALVPFVSLENGKTYAAADGADLIEPGADGKSLKIASHQWAQIGGKSGERFDVGLTSEVQFRIENNKLIRRETLTANKDLTIKHWRVAVRTTADQTSFEIENGERTDFLRGREGTLVVRVKTDWKTTSEILATGDGRLGKGVLGAIPLHLVFDSVDLKLKKDQQMTWEINLESVK